MGKFPSLAILSVNKSVVMVEAPVVAGKLEPFCWFNPIDGHQLIKILPLFRPNNLQLFQSYFQNIPNYIQ